MYKFTANSLRRNYETSLISADPLSFDLRSVMAAIISCGFERRIIVIRAVLRGHGKFSNGTAPPLVSRVNRGSRPLYRCVTRERNVSFKVARRGNIDQRYTEL